MLALATVATACIAASGGALASGGGGGKVCTQGIAFPADLAGLDYDADGLNDTFSAGVEFGPFYGEYWLNISFSAPGGATVASMNHDDIGDGMISYGDGYNFELLNTTDPRGNYTVYMTVDDPAGSCGYVQYTQFLYPPGTYGPLVTSSALNQSADPNGIVMYDLTIVNAGNNPDSFAADAVSENGWPFVLSAAGDEVDAGANLSARIILSVPRDAPPNLGDNLTLHVSSMRNVSAGMTLTLLTRVAPQRYGLNVTALNTTEAREVGAVINFAFTVVNRGNARDTFLITVPTAPSGWQTTPSGPNVVLWEGESANFTVEVRYPSSYTSASLVNITVLLHSNDPGTTGSATAVARLILPDFEVGNSGIVVNNSSPTSGANVSVQVNVVNHGGPIAVTFAVSLSDGHSNFTKIIDMSLAGTTVASFDWTAVEGAITLTAFADSTNSVPEDDETNNHATLSVTVAPGAHVNVAPTAVAGGASASSTAGANVTISASSSTDTDGTVAGYYFDFGDGTNSGWVTGSSITHAYTNEGNYTVTIKVRDNEGAESAPTTEAVHIAAGSGPSGGGGGGGGGSAGSTDMTLVLIVAVVAAAGVAGALIMMKKRAPPASPPGSAPASPPAEPPKAP